LRATTLTADAGCARSRRTARRRRPAAPGEAEQLRHLLDLVQDDRRAEVLGGSGVSLARSVDDTNDERADLKRQLNTLLGCRLVEEKSHGVYRNGAQDGEVRGKRT